MCIPILSLCRRPLQIYFVDTVGWYSLVVEDDVGEPDVGGGHVEAVDPAVLLGVPPQLVVKPVLLDPQVGRHHLLPQILKCCQM